jgi:hypothetical protein
LPGMGGRRPGAPGGLSGRGGGMSLSSMGGMPSSKQNDSFSNFGKIVYVSLHPLLQARRNLFWTIGNHLRSLDCFLATVTLLDV